jgi:septal ring factor EnvC (AmiA/AmiB activator)
MTELEKTLRDALLHMEGELSSASAAQNKALEEQRQTLKALQAALNSQEERINRANNDLQTLTRRLRELGDVYRSLEPLLPILEGILNGSEG